MKVTDVSKQDGLQCAHLIGLLAKVQGLSGPEAERFVTVKQWLHGVAVSMAKELEKLPKEAIAAAVPAAAESFRVTAMGSLPGKPSKSKSSPKKRK